MMFRTVTVFLLGVLLVHTARSQVINRSYRTGYDPGLGVYHDTPGVYPGSGLYGDPLYTRDGVYRDTYPYRSGLRGILRRRRPVLDHARTVSRTEHRSDRYTPVVDPLNDPYYDPVRPTYNGALDPGVGLY